MAHPPLPHHLVIYTEPNPTIYYHVESNDAYQIVGEYFMEAEAKEGYLYRRVDKDHPAIIGRAKDIFHRRFKTKEN